MDISERKFEEDIEHYLIEDADYWQFSKLDEKNQRKSVFGYDKSKSIYTPIFCKFINDTQPDVMAKFNRIYGARACDHLINELDKQIENFGLIYVLRHGFKDAGSGCTIYICYFKPDNKLNKTTNELYGKNIFGVDRQFHYSNTLDPDKTIDMVLSLNGIPIFALELKNQFKGQNYDDAIVQYKTNRNPKESCFKLNRRFLAYFAVDLDEVWVSTKLDGLDTQFMPFNQGTAGAGRSGGKGNPENPDGYKTSYLWEKIFQKDSVLKLIQKYISYVKTKKEIIFDGGTKKVDVENIIFPRYHQLDVVDKILDDVKTNGVGHDYLIEHSPGSGKTNSIAWLAYQLSSLHDNENKPVFTSVIVITNRIVLDNQLQDTIKSFEHNLGLIETITSSSDKSRDDSRLETSKGSSGLIHAINNKKRIIVCTIQKFLFAYKEFKKIKGSTFAIIIDEAHQGQSGQSANTLKKSLVDISIEIERYAYEEGINPEDVDVDNEAIFEILCQGKHKNQSFFAFTATPRGETLETFGVQDPANHTYSPFHVYSMRQAIEEGFILNVLQNYTTVRQAFKIVKTTKDNPEFVESDATRALINYYKDNKQTIENKVEVIMSNFLNNGRYKIGGKGKAMVVTDSRKAAILYYFAIKDFIKKHPTECVGTDVLVAFSGDITIDGKTYSEKTLNIDDEGKSINTDKKFRAAFRSNRYNIMVVADKYQIGFDEGQLHSMYIDKTLRGIDAVQTISRLNRIYPGKEDTFVMDFVNTEDDMRKAFQPYYEDVTFQGETDCEKIYAIRRDIAEFFIYDDNDIDAYYDFMSNQADSKKNWAIGILRSRLSPAISRYNQLESEEKKFEFRSLLSNFVKTYSYMTSLIRVHDEGLYKEYTFVSALTRFLPSEKRGIVDIEDKVKLEYSGIKTSFQGSIVLENKDATFKPIDAKKRVRSNKKDTLQNILDKLNETIGSSFDESKKLMITGIYNEFISEMDNKRFKKISKGISETMFLNEYFREEFKNVVFKCYESDKDAYKQLMTDREFYKLVTDVMGDYIYKKFRNED